MAQQNPAPPEKPSLASLFLPMLVMIIVYYFFFGNNQEAKPPEQPPDLVSSEMVGVGKALQAYGHYHAGVYPTKLDQLVPLYLPTLPTTQGGYAYESVPGAFTLSCSATHEQYTSARGLEKAAP